MFMATANIAHAGTCTETAPGSGDWTCSGAANSGSDTPETLGNGTGSELIVTTASGFGIDNASGTAFILTNTAGGNNLTFTDAYASDISGTGNGIFAVNNGTGITSITTTGVVTGTGTGTYGIYARNLGTDLTISAADVSGADGISVANLGTGSTSVTATGTVTGTIYRGIVVNNVSTSTNMTVSAVDVSGGTDGIYAFNNGTGFNSVTATGTVTGSAGSGILAVNYGTNLTVSAVDASGSNSGIDALNYGTGSNSVTATGTVTGNTNYGINARNFANSSTDLTVFAADASGPNVGIFAYNNGTGSTDVTATGTVTSTINSGINASNSSNATNLTVSAVDVSGGTDGIRAINNGSGSNSITATGTVTGTINYGINVFGNSTATNLTVSAANASGGTNGIVTYNSGTGSTRVTATGTVAGTTSYGISAWNDSTATDLTVSAADVSGGYIGIEAYNNGTGTTSVTTTGAVSAVNAGILVYSQNDTFAVSVDSGSVAAVGGGNDAYARAIQTSGAKGGTIDIAAGAVVDGSASGIAIRDGDYATGLGDVLDGTDLTGGDVVVTTYGDVKGDAILGKGNDTFNLAGGDFDGDIYGDDTLASVNDGNDTFNFTGGDWHSGFFGGNGSDTANISSPTYDGTAHVLDGGDDYGTGDGWIDTLTFAGVTSDANGTNILNWENIVINGGAITIVDGALETGSDAGTGLTVMNGGVLDGSDALALTGNLVIKSGGAFVGTGGGAGVYSISGDVSNQGTITTQDGVVGDVVSIGGNYSGGGTITVDANLDGAGSADQIVIAGNVTGPATTVNLNNVGSGIISPTTGNGIFVVSAGGTSSAGSFVLNPSDAQVGAFDYSINQASDGKLYLSSTYQAGVPVMEAYGQALLGLNSLNSLRQRTGNRSWTPGLSKTIDDTSTAAGVWGQFEGSLAEQNFATSVTGSAYDQDFWRLRTGVEAPLTLSDSGALFVGTQVNYGVARTNVTSVYGNGRIMTNVLGFGLGMTWYGNSGFYADIQGRYNHYSSDVRNGLGRMANNVKSDGYAGGLELGYVLAQGNSWKITPQAQLTYGTVDYNSFSDGTSATAALADGSVNSWRGRGGLELSNDKNWTSESGKEMSRHFYGVLNLHYEFDGKSNAAVSNTPLYSRPEQLWGEVGAGFQHNAVGSISVFGEAAYSVSFANGGDNNKLNGRIGLRANF
ncbi:autotransporter outer membrane beta-barrel domain-containing protein [Altericroceibacterium endophyticum]|uniref:Autotransporter outer membrane beta-barrel domain-containing protein n=1 Tax=Altericroceibacterium endophyticum TaxID=1808508 RepID=A0A6I4T3S9_9SPHN|nr:autotransporter outer membrane beta-barrel domain-containing protein [Altericroceibacterium endophyticum]MXO64801.1 autotransporter outer membrane beta-barrel domain-containing protein [Altericroceibacterium endophyticum]